MFVCEVWFVLQRRHMSQTHMDAAQHGYGARTFALRLQQRRGIRKAAAKALKGNAHVAFGLFLLIAGAFVQRSRRLVRERTRIVRTRNDPAPPDLLEQTGMYRRV